MKKTLTNNLGLKALALAFSILLWIIVMNNERPITTKTYIGVPVTLLHPELITNQGNTYRVDDNYKKVTVTVRGKKDVLKEIKLSDIKVTADVKKLDTATRSLIPYEVSIPTFQGQYVDAETAEPNLVISIELATTKTFPIVPSSSGEPRNGYQIGSLEADPQQVRISGPESVVNSIDKVVAQVNTAGISKDEVKEADMILYNAAGMVIDSTLVETNLGEEGLNVKVRVLHTKSVPVEFDTSGIVPASGYIFEGISVQPETVEIVGTREQLENLEAIEIPADVIEETNLTKSLERTIDITEYLPYWAKAKDESAGISVLVKISVTKIGTRTLDYPVGSISLLNVPKDYSVKYDSEGSIEIMISSDDPDRLADFALEQGSVSINLVNIKAAGNYTVPVQITLPDGIELVQDVSVRITLEKNDGGNNG
ncbi:MAG: CdaR family protein [Bariatricus sp.]|nr:CdaR family protein [Bariatricus sp.]